MSPARRRAETEPAGAADERRDGTRKTPTRRPRGRPPRLSRDGIVDAVVAMLEREPGEPLTIARIASEVDAVPAALYRHFENLDDLLDGVVARVLATSESDFDPDASWQDQLAEWMRGLRSHLLQYPAVIALTARSGRTSPAWLDASSALVDVLRGAGLAGRELALTYLWVLEMTVGLVMQEASLSLPEQIASARASRKELSERARTRFAPLANELADLDGDAFFDFVVTRTTSLIEQSAARRD